MSENNATGLDQKASSGVAVSVGAGWREDVLASRDLNDREKQGFAFLLSWFETWRVSRRLQPTVESARQFWKQEVTMKEESRKKPLAHAMNIVSV